MLSRMNRLLDCPHCASSGLEVVRVEFEGAPTLAKHRNECGAFGPPGRPLPMLDDLAHSLQPGSKRSPA